MSERRLQFNPEPLKIVPAAQRDVWTKRPGWRCYHEDGRGRCTSRETKLCDGEWLCAKHRGPS